MIRNLKTLGLALMAAFALSAVAASAASALEQGELTSDGPVTLTLSETGVAKNKFMAFGGAIECPGSTYTGHKVTTVAETGGVEHKNAGIGKNLIAVPATTVTTTPHYKQTNALGEPNCVGSLGTSATIHMNGCDYVVHIGKTTPVGNKENTYGATFDIVCPAGKDITWTLWTTKALHKANPNSPECIWHIPAQTGLVGAHATDTNVNDGHVELTGELTGIKIVRTLVAPHPGGIFCSNTETTVGKFALDVTVAGHKLERRSNSSLAFRGLSTQPLC